MHRINIILPVGVLASTGNPDGAGPIAEDKGATGFSYQDATRSLIFGTEQDHVEDSALGKIVTVVIVPGNGPGGDLAVLTPSLIIGEPCPRLHPCRSLLSLTS